MTTLNIRRDQVREGDVLHSSHGYKLRITSIDDSAKVRTDERHIGFIGTLGHNDDVTRSERYPAGSMVTVDRDTDTPMVTLRAGGRRGNDWVAEWLAVIHQANRIYPGMFGQPEFASTPEGYVEDYPDARVTIDTDAEGCTFPEADARIVSKTALGAVVLVEVARVLSIECTATSEEKVG